MIELTNEYPKIPTVWQRDPATKNRTLLEGRWTTPELEYLASCMWDFTEKVDGTNIRVTIGPTIRYDGRTANAQIPAKLVAALDELFQSHKDELFETFQHGAVLYGEGYGAGIQKGGGNYRPQQSFVLFDIKVGDWWLKRETVDEIAHKLALDVVPIVGIGTLLDMVEQARRGFLSRWGDFPAEGIVARPVTELRDRGGRRIITKIKAKDFA